MPEIILEMYEHNKPLHEYDVLTNKYAAWAVVQTEGRAGLDRIMVNFIDSLLEATQNGE